jgi:mono/diheme cytochrome c family protein
MIRTLGLACCLVAFGAANCDNPCIGLQCPDVPKPDIGGDADPNADWCSVYSEVFEPECSRCHDPSGTNVRPHLKVRSDFTADDMVAHLRNERASSPPWVTQREPDNSQVWKRVGEGSMPPGITMGGSVAEDARLRKLVRDWITNGATTTCNAANDAGPSSSDAGAASDAGSAADSGATDAGAALDTGPVDSGPPPDPMCVVAAMFRTSCLGCHAGGGRGGYSMGDGSLAAIRASLDGTSSVGIPYMTPSSSDQSYLYLRIAGRGAEIQGGRSSRMPPNGRWADADIAALQTWIDQGAQNFVCP